MITKKMHMMAKPIASTAWMRKNLRSGGTGCSRKTAAFAKEIIDKYTKRLNDPFDPVSLVFLEQMANGSEFARADGAAVIVTCRLLAYLIQNTGQAGLFSDRHSFLVQQLTGQVERNLEILKDSAADAGRELSRCYQEYQNISKMDHAADGEQRRDVAHPNLLDRNVRMEQISNLQERMHRFAQRQIQYHPLESVRERGIELPEPEEKPGRKTPENRMPFVMTHAFFANLNHWIRENRHVDYHQMWKQANERQMVQQKLKYHMQRFLQEEDFIRQEEQLSNMIWQYGKSAVLEYLNQADLKVYEKLLPVLHTLSGRSDKRQGHWRTDQRGASRRENGNTESSGQESTNAAGRNPAAVTGQVLEEYQAAGAQLEHLLAEADEETKALLQETAAKYKKYFLEYVRAVSGIQQASAAEDMAGRQELQVFLGVSRDFRDTSRERAGMQVQAEEDQEVFSDAEIELLLQKKENKIASVETEAAELKLKLLAYREIAEQFQQEGSTVLHRETLQKITKLLDQDSFLYIWRLAEYQKADAKLSEIIAGSDDVTKNMLLEKAEEYQDLFYRYISADQTKRETAADGMSQMEHPKAADDEMPWRSVVQSGEYETLFSDRELGLEQKLRLLAYREIAKRLLKEDSTVIQREKLQKITQLFTGSGRQIEPFTKEIVRNAFDIRGILEHGSLPERKLLFLTAEKTVDELLIRLREAGNDGPGKEAAQAAEYEANQQQLVPSEQIRDLVCLKNQLLQVSGQGYRGTDDWGFLLTNEAGRKLLRIMQQEENPVKDVWKQKVQQSLTDFYHHIKEEGIRSQVSEGSSFFAEWNPVFRQEEWRQLRSLVRNQPGQELHEKQLDYRNQPVQIQPENAFWHLQQSVSMMQSPERKLEHTSIGQSIERELESVWTDRGEKMRQAIPGSGYLQNRGFYNSVKLLRKDIWKKVPDRVQQPTQYQAFMRPPVQDVPVEAAAVHTQQRAEDTAVWRIAGGQTAIVHTQQHTKDTARFQRIAEEKEQQQKQELQRLEGSLLDYRSQFQAKTVQLDQIEKKLAAQEKELKLVRDSQHTVRKQGKTAAERRQMLNQLKAELQLERMRSGLV